MPIRYEYNSTCCGHLYMETRMINDAQVVTKCNVCAQGDYVLSNEVVLEDVPVPVYQAVEETIVSAKDKFLAAGFTEEEINLLIQETIINENNENI